jgi:hypothetical protein
VRKICITNGVPIRKNQNIIFEHFIEKNSMIVKD